jgi:signal transduction histidine kinase
VTDEAALRRSPVLAELSEEVLTSLLRDAKMVTLAAGEVLMAEGSDPDAMYIVVEGNLEITKRGGSSEIPLNTCGPGEPIGELALVHRRPRTATVRALEETRLLCIDADAFDRLLEQPSSARTLLSTATERLETQELRLREYGKMAALGTLTAGLLHELNNPAAAIRRSIEQLGDLLRADGAGTDPKGVVTELDPLARSDLEQEVRRALEALGVDRGWEVAGPLADLGVDPTTLGTRLAEIDPADPSRAARQLASRGQTAALLAEARTAASRISEIVGAVKSFSHHDEAPVQNVVIHDGLDAALTLVHHKIIQGITVERDYDPDLPPVEGYPGDLNSVWTNLIDNAIDATGEDGTIVLRTRGGPDHVTVEVIDDGTGIPPEVMDRIFDPFFTTKPVGQGTGLGLPIAFSTVTQKHGGRLEVTSKPGHTAFLVTLPHRLPRR